MNYAVVYPRFWLWYFVASVALTLVNSLYSVSKAFGGTGAPSAFGVALEWASLWPLYGYARQVRVNPRWLWLSIFVVSSVGIGLVVALVLFVSLSRVTLQPFLYVVPVLTLAAPSVLALHQYVFRSPHIWSAA